jgi:carbamoyltransferase
VVVIGISGGVASVDEEVATPLGGHDAAAVILHDGQLIAAFEEERLDRVKHTDKFPAAAIRGCLDAVGLDLNQVDCLALNKSEFAVDAAIHAPGFSVSLAEALDLRIGPVANARAFVQALVQRHMGTTVSPDRIHFVKHHIAHAQSAFAMSGWDEALVVTLDGVGDGEAGTISVGTRDGLEILRTIHPTTSSLGFFYEAITRILGFRTFDEYKVMGLASYGDPGVFRSRFRRLYKLQPRGEYTINTNPVVALLPEIRSRYRSEPLQQLHMDVAAAAQEVLELVVLHILNHFRDVTGMARLCLAGGIAHNCTLNGKIAKSGLFSGVFVQPAAHDAGCALGAAAAAWSQRKSSQLITRMPLPFLGTDVRDGSGPRAKLEAWAPALSIRRSADVTEDAADLLAAGRIIGWVQGRAEFGPRALGNRSILADPRPAENKQLINSIVKKREDFRPFAPAVVAERAAVYFELPECDADLSHMTYVLDVRPEMRSTLGAVTHVDGTARIQTVTKEGNERFWQLITAFEKRTGVPILLNTSFNNNAEPIVDSLEDAVVCFLTTDLDRLVVDDFVVSKAPLSYETCRRFVPSVPAHLSLDSTSRLAGSGRVRRFEIRGARYAPAIRYSPDVPISESMFRLLERSDGRQDLQTVVGSLSLSEDEIWSELVELWSKRVIRLLPARH